MTFTATALLNGLTLGTDTPYAIDVDGIGGLGTPEPKVAQTDYDGRDGAFSAPEFTGVRVITIPVNLLGNDVDDALNGLDALNAAWAPARDGVDVDLTLTLGTHVYVFHGRPRGVNALGPDLKSGVIAALCTFVATDPNAAAP